MEQVGVAAVVQGLSGFLGDMGKMDDSIRKLISPTNILGSVFGTLGNILEGVGSFIANTLAHALGELLADAVEWVTKQIQEMVTASIEMANELQRLEVRLNGLNLPTTVDEMDDYTEAMKKAKAATQEQLSWLQQLAVAAPFGPTQIADIYTAARAMGYADDAARTLTTSILEFAAGMGLTDVEAERIIVNLRQMGTRGKVTGREMADLARGALLPLDDVLQRMARDMGISKDELNKLIASAEGVDPKIFVTAFEEMVKEEPRFVGAMGRLGRTFEFATKNFKEFLANLGAKNILLPIFTILGERIAEITDQFVKFNDQGELIHTEKWDAAIAAATRVGTAITDVLSALLDLAPSAEGIADGIVGGLNGIADWLDAHKDDIVKFVQDSAKWFRTDLLPAIQQVWDFLFGTDTRTGAIQKFGDWLKNTFVPFIQNQVAPAVSDLMDTIFGPKKKSGAESTSTVDPGPVQQVGQAISALVSALPSILALLGAIGDVIVAAFGAEEPKDFADFVTNTLIPAIDSLTKFIKDNQAAFATLLVVIVALEVLAFIGGLVWSLISGLTALVVSFVLVAAIVGIVGAAMLIWKGVMWLVHTIVDLLFFDAKVLALVWGVAITSIMLIVANLMKRFTDFKNNVVQTFNEVIAAIKNKDWAGAGKALVDGVIRGFKNSWVNFITLVKQLATNALNTFNSIFQIHSPSAAMADIGMNLVKGLAKGVKDSAGLAVKAMTDVSSMVMAAPQMAYSAAVTSPSQNTYSNTNNFNQTINTNASHEPIAQDFGMMQSLVGG